MATTNRNVRSNTNGTAARVAGTNDTDVIDTDTAIINGIVRVVGRRTTAWVGSMTELSTALSRVVSKTPSDWPSNPRGMRAGVDRVVRKLRRLGIKTSFGRTSDHSRKRFVQFVR